MEIKYLGSYVISEIIKSFSNNGEEPPIYFYRDKDKYEIDLLIEQNNILYPVEIKKTATPSSDDAKNFFITNRIKNIKIAQGIIICNCSQVLNVKNKDSSVLAIPVEYI